MTSITSLAEAFFDACETGKGWDVCSAYCTTDATFSAQAEPLSGITTLAQYTDWMKGIFTPLPDARYELKSFATDASRNNVSAYAVFHATHTGPGGPVPPTGRGTSTDYVYVMQFEGEKIVHMTKIWNSGLTLKDFGWAQNLDREGAVSRTESHGRRTSLPNEKRMGRLPAPYVGEAAAPTIKSHGASKPFGPSNW
jgi:predicted ester cyclase